jgi:hypothetical protein
VPEIADWLKKLGMSEYASHFADERIDFSVLPNLTDQDLNDLGVVVRDRRKILCAIAELDFMPAIQLARIAEESSERAQSRPETRPEPEPATPPATAASEPLRPDSANSRSAYLRQGVATTARSAGRAHGVPLPAALVRR